jgi:hypothetical protein
VSGDLTFRMVRERIARGEATGILCPADQVEDWMARLEQAVPLVQRVGCDTLYFHSGAIVVFRSTPEAARAWERGRGRPVLWVDEGNAPDVLPVTPTRSRTSSGRSAISSVPATPGRRRRRAGGGYMLDRGVERDGGTPCDLSVGSRCSSSSCQAAA